MEGTALVSLLLRASRLGAVSLAEQPWALKVGGDGVNMGRMRYDPVHVPMSHAGPAAGHFVNVA